MGLNSFAPVLTEAHPVLILATEVAKMRAGLFLEIDRKTVLVSPIHISGGFVFTPKSCEYPTEFQDGTYLWSANEEGPMVPERTDLKRVKASRQESGSVG